MASGRSTDAGASMLSVDRLTGAVAAIAAIDGNGLAGGSANDTGLSVVAAGDTVSLERASRVRVMNAPSPTPPDCARYRENSLSNVSCMVDPPKPSGCSDSSSSDRRICCTICSISIASNCCESSATLARSSAGVWRIGQAPRRVQRERRRRRGLEGDAIAPWPR